MTTDVRTFRAASMQEALDVVRQEMGADAVILHTRQISQRRGLLWRRPKSEVEITAGLGINVRTHVKRPAAAAAVGVAALPAVERASRRFDAAAGAATGERPVPPRSPRPASRSLPSDDVSVSFSPSALRQAARFSESTASAGISLEANPTAPARQEPMVAASRITVPDDDRTAAFATKLDSIQKMLESLGRASQQPAGREIPAELFTLYTDLIDADVEEDLARELAFKLKENCTPAQLGDVVASKALLTAMVESEIRVSDPIAPVRGRRKVVALVGPTGVGKTTTIAKLAANFRLRDGVKMGLVTVDTYRIAAVEQLRTYAEIIDLPMKVVTSPLEMRRALDELVGLDLVLIDTAGRSPRDDLQIQELKTLLAEANVDEVHLVLSMTSSQKSLEATAQKFATAGTTSLILTKLDEAAGMGAVLSVARSVGLPVSYLTTGQDVPDDIEPARPGRLARLILGEERLFG